MSYRRSRTRRKQYDAWNIDPGTYDVAPTVLHAVDSVKVIESGPLRSIIRVCADMAKLEIRAGHHPLCR